MWNKIKAPFIWVGQKWRKFENWLASKVPGLKTKLMAGAGAISSAALLVQEYIRGLPLESILTPNKILIANVILFSLIFWLRGLAK